MTRFGKMVYGLICIYFAIATGIIVRITGGTSTNITMFLISGWIVLIGIFFWNTVRTNRIFNEYKNSFETLEEQVISRGRIGEEKSMYERYLLKMGENYIKDGVFDTKKTKEVAKMMEKINQFSNEGKGE